MEVFLSSGSQKQYSQLPTSAQRKIKKKLLALKQDPNLGKKLSGDLVGVRSLRAWPYRILYEVNTSQNRIEVHKIAHRQGVYK